MVASLKEMAEVVIAYTDALPPAEFKEYVTSYNISYPLAMLRVHDNISEYDLRVSMGDSNLTEYGAELLESAYQEIKRKQRSLPAHCPGPESVVKDGTQVYVTRSQIDAAKMIVERDKKKRRATGPAIQKIAAASIAPPVRFCGRDAEHGGHAWTYVDPDSSPTEGALVVHCFGITSGPVQTEEVL